MLRQLVGWFYSMSILAVLFNIGDCQSFHLRSIFAWFDFTVSQPWLGYLISKYYFFCKELYFYLIIIIIIIIIIIMTCSHSNSSEKPSANTDVKSSKEINDNNHHHHHIALVARISLTLSRHSSLSFIALGRSSGQHPVSSHSCWMYVRAGRPAFARPCVGIHKSASLISSSLLLQQCPACLVRLTWIVFVIGGRWPYSWCLVGCCFQDLFRIARSIFV